MITIALWVLSAAVSILAVYWLSSSNVRDDVAFVPGPESDSLLVGTCNSVSACSFLSHSVGNMSSLANAPSDEKARGWSKTYGGIVKLHGVLAVRRHVLLISDPVALRHIFGSSAGHWDLLKRNRDAFLTLFGPGIVAVSGADHVRQRRVIAQALTPAGVRAMIEPISTASRNARHPSSSRFTGLDTHRFIDTECLAECVPQEPWISNSSRYA